MREISFEESKQIMLETLKSIDRCCRANNINYSLCWGSLIGAIRHHGFVPWDDDIDLMMSRDDYNRFLRVYNDPDYDVHTPSKEKNFIHLLTKISNKKTKTYFNYNKNESLFGLWISIFPYDNAPDEDLKQWERKRTILVHLYHFKTFRYWDNDSTVRKVAKFMSKMLVFPFTSISLAKKIEKHLSKYNTIQTKKICIWDNGYGFTRYFYFPADLFDGYEEVYFEGVKCMVIKGYDQFLRLYYGDYMQLPPEDQQVPSHDYKAYFID